MGFYCLFKYWSFLIISGFFVSWNVVLEVGDGVFEVLSTSGDTHLGGDDFDKVSQNADFSEILCK